MGIKLSDLPPHVQALVKAQDAKGREGSQRASPPRRVAGLKNKTEARFASRLEMLKRAGEVLCYAFEPFTLPLGPKLTYTPDFLVMYADGSLVFEEVKGYERDDAVAKFKMAAGKYPQFRFRMWTVDKGGWRVTRDLHVGVPSRP